MNPVGTTPAHARQRDGTGSPTASELRAALLARKTGRKAWRAVACEIGMPRSGAMLSRVAAGKQKPSPALYAALGFEPPVRVVEVPAGYGVGKACNTCGQVHTTKTCPTARPARRKHFGLVTRTVGAVCCIQCGRNERADENTRAGVIKTLNSAGWVWTNDGPVCASCKVEI